MNWLFARDTVIALAILGAIVSTLAAVLQSRGTIDEQRAKQLNLAGYGFMAASMFLFVVIGFRS
ncbi:MAG: hypothetical protein K2Y16_09180 [Burkholderiales bacterium]|nr:hypothetical protein [Burkholderiales bacterium]